MVGCLKTCGLLCALLTALQVCCAVNDYQCYEGKAYATKTVPMVTCGHAFYRLSFSFSKKGDEEKNNEAVVQKHKDMTIKYTIILTNKQKTPTEPTSITLKGIPVKERPLEFVTDHVADLDEVEVKVQLPGNAIGDSYTNLEFNISLENHLSGHLFTSKVPSFFFVTEPDTGNRFKVVTLVTEPGKYIETGYPRCVAFVTNSANPDVIYGGCIKELGFPFGSSVFRFKKSGRDISILGCLKQCVIFPEFTKTQVTCPVSDNDPKKTCQKAVIEIAEKSPLFDMAKKLQPLPPMTTPEPEDPSKNTSSPKKPDNPNTTKNTNSTPTGDLNTESTVHSHSKSSTTDTTNIPKSTNDPPKNTTCKPESGSGAPIGLIVALVIFILGTLGALAVALLYFFKHRSAVSTLEQQEDKVQEQEDKAKEQDKKVQELEKKCAELQETVDRCETQRDATGTECTNSKSTEQTRKVTKKEQDTKKEPKKETKKETKNEKRYPETESERVLAKEKLDGTPGKAKWASAEDETTDTRTEKRWSHGDKKK